MATEKQDITLAVTATGLGNDHFTYQWIKEKDDSISSITDEQYTSSLTIKVAKESDSGLYYCKVKNKWNIQNKSNKAFLKVICKFGS